MIKKQCQLCGKKIPKDFKGHPYLRRTFHPVLHHYFYMCPECREKIKKLKKELLMKGKI
ncbi:MAG: hypothetical protein ACTSVE_00165 [Candidatus Helarchaeota archaeon]